MGCAASTSADKGKDSASPCESPAQCRAAEKHARQRQTEDEELFSALGIVPSGHHAANANERRQTAQNNHLGSTSTESARNGMQMSTVAGTSTVVEPMCLFGTGLVPDPSGFCLSTSVEMPTVTNGIVLAGGGTGGAGSSVTGSPESKKNSNSFLTQSSQLTCCSTRAFIEGVNPFARFLAAPEDPEMDN